MPAYALITTGEILAAASCNSIADNAYFAREFEAAFGKPVRNEQGALWYKASGEAYGTQIREVFVSNVSSRLFVGVVLTGKPEAVVASVPTSQLYPTNVFPTNNHWIGTDGRSIMWHDGKYTKMFCTPK
jgi:hypothetical protein